MRWLIAVLAALVLVPAARGAADAPAPSLVATRGDRLIHYRAHDGGSRPAWLLLPVGYDGRRPLPLVISPHGRGVGAAREHADLGRPARRGRVRRHQPGRRGTPAALVLVGLPRADRRPGAHARESSRRTGSTSTGRRIYAFGGSMGGQETLLLAALHPHLLAGAVGVRPCDRHAPALRRLRRAEGRRRAAGAGADRDRRHARAGAACLRRSQPRHVRGAPCASPTSRSSSTGARTTGSSATSGSRRRGSPSRLRRRRRRSAALGLHRARGSTRPRCAPRSACRVRSRASGSCRGATCRRCVGQLRPAPVLGA